MKTFSGANKLFYLNEVKIFKSLKATDGVVRYLGDFTKRHAVEPTTYHIILELGNCDLSNYFRSMQPPVLKEEIKAFWSDMRKVAIALEGIRNLKMQIRGVQRQARG